MLPRQVAVLPVTRPQRGRQSPGNVARVDACESGGRLIILRGSRSIYRASFQTKTCGLLVTVDRALCWLGTICLNVIGPEIAPSPSLVLGAGESHTSTENFIIYLFVVPGSRIRVDCTTCGNVTTPSMSYSLTLGSLQLAEQKEVT